MMKTIYLVRHGEAEGNASGRYQNALTPLTDKGKEQARLLAERATRLPIDVIIASPMERTKQTAAIIAEKVKKPIEYSELFVERIRPSEQRGQLKNDPKVQEIDEMLRSRFGESGWHYSDEENFDDLKARAALALAHLEQRSEEAILVVGHGLFTHALIARAIFGKDLSPAGCAAFFRSVHTGNTGLSVLKYDSVDEEDQPSAAYWKLYALNDETHLG